MCSFERMQISVSRKNEIPLRRNPGTARDEGWQIAGDPSDQGTLACNNTYEEASEQRSEPFPGTVQMHVHQSMCAVIVCS